MSPANRSASSQTAKLVVRTPSSRCRLGVVRADVTPPAGIYHRMWGAAIHDRASGIHRLLTATALALAPLDADAATPQTFVALDHCLLWAGEMDALLARASQVGGIAQSSLIITFSHTHAAGLMGLERAGLPGGELIAAYLDSLGDAIGQAIAAARRMLQPVTLSYGYGRCNLAAHRDLWDPALGDRGEGGFVCGFNPSGQADDTLLVARATDENGKLVATFVNYACHPTTLAWQNTLVSPDYPGAMRETIEAQLGGTCVFLQGASGDLGPREGYVGDPAVADRNGRQLAFAALSTLESLPPPATEFRYLGAVESGARLGPWANAPVSPDQLASAAKWSVSQLAINLLYRPDLPTVAQLEHDRDQHLARELAARDAGNESLARDERAMAERSARQIVRMAGLPAGESFPMPVTLLRLGEAIWIAVESELYQYFQVRLRRQFPGVPLVIMTLANGTRPAYLPTADTYGKGIYQESVSLLAPGCLENLTEEIGREIASLLAT